MLKVRHAAADARLHVARKTKALDEGHPPIPVYDPSGQSDRDDFGRHPGTRAMAANQVKHSINAIYLEFAGASVRNSSTASASSAISRASSWALVTLIERRSSPCLRLRRRPRRKDR